MTRNPGGPGGPIDQETLARGFDRLARLLLSGDEVRRQDEVARLLRTRSAPFIETAVSRLIDTLDYRNGAKRRLATASLTEIGHPAAVALMEKLFETRDRLLRVFIAEALAEVGKGLDHRLRTDVVLALLRARGPMREEPERSALDRACLVLMQTRAQEMLEEEAREQAAALAAAAEVPGSAVPDGHPELPAPAKAFTSAEWLLQ